jgi:hypothetical protein
VRASVLEFVVGSSATQVLVDESPIVMWDFRNGNAAEWKERSHSFVVLTMAFDPFPPPQKVDPAFGRDSLDDRFQVAFAVREP